MVTWRGAVPIGSDGGWAILLIMTEDIGGGLLAYTYSVKPGVNVQVVVPRQADMLPPYDSTYARIVAQLAPAARACS